jgi:hypothetical protein
MGCAEAATAASVARRAAHAPAADRPRARRVSTPAQTRDRPGEVVAGLLATLAIFGSAIAIVERPVRITVFTILIALIAAGLGGRHQRLAAFAIFFSGACFVVGMVIAILANKPIF